MHAPPHHHTAPTCHSYSTFLDYEVNLTPMPEVPMLSMGMKMCDVANDSSQWYRLRKEDIMGIQSAFSFAMLLTTLWNEPSVVCRKLAAMNSRVGL